MNCTEIAVITEDPDVSAADAKDYAEACDLQIRDHVAPEYSRIPVPVRFYKTRAEVPATAALIPFLPQSAMDTPDAIAYHTEKDDRIVGIVCAALARANGMDPCVALSHEICEPFKDPCCNASTQGSDGNLYDDEICDGVQDLTYAVTLASGRVCQVSNYVTAAWHDPQDKQGPYDRNGVLTSPHSKTSGGYLQYVDSTGKRRQFGMKPAWRERCSVRGFKRE